MTVLSVHYDCYCSYSTAAIAGATAVVITLRTVIPILFCSCCDDAEEGVDHTHGLSDLLSWQDCEALQRHGFHSIRIFWAKPHEPKNILLLECISSVTEAWSNHSTWAAPWAQLQ